MPQIKRQSELDIFSEACANSKDLPTWSGELYFELHRGTYTSQAYNKKMNRYCEFLLRDLELLSCFEPNFPKSYPQKEIETMWKTVLLNQFHDIIPGSSVTEVYEQSKKEYDELASRVNSLIQDKLTKIARIDKGHSLECPVALFQFAEISGEGKINAPKGIRPNSIKYNGKVTPVQKISAFGETSLIFQVPDEALGAVITADLSKEKPLVFPKLSASTRKLENEHFRVKFDSNGNITSIRAQEDDLEFVEENSLANLFQLFEDKPTFWSAWDVDIFALETQKDLTKSEKFEIVETGPVRVAAEVVKRFGKSTITQRISLGPTPGIRFDTEIDWKESEKMLKVAFPINVNANKTTCEIQFGNVERPTHRNTSWDMARFEICAQKWIDISEGDHGVALINDSKYGHDVLGNTMRLTLLRAPKAPDPNCDMGTHRFTYVLLPHFGSYNWSGVVQTAYALNASLKHAYLKKTMNADSITDRLVSCDDRNIVIESVKKAEDGNAIIVRMYECHNARGIAELAISKKTKKAFLCDLLENHLKPLNVENGHVAFDYKPFEIITIKLML